MAFMEQLRNVLSDRITYTENGALAYATTGKALMDLNFAVASLRNESEESIARRFTKAFHEDKILALKWLFFLRDVRGGLGERRGFRVILQNLIQVHISKTFQNISKIHSATLFHHTQHLN